MFTSNVVTQSQTHWNPQRLLTPSKLWSAVDPLGGYVLLAMHADKTQTTLRFSTSPIAPPTVCRMNTQHCHHQSVHKELGSTDWGKNRGKAHVAICTIV